MHSLRLPMIAASVLLAGGLLYPRVSHAQDAAPSCSADVMSINSCRVFPNFRACTPAQAERWLTECGYTGNFPVEEEYNPLPEGTISTQSVPAGTVGSNDRNVVFFTSIGPNPAWSEPPVSPSAPSSPTTPTSPTPSPSQDPSEAPTFSETPQTPPSPTDSPDATDTPRGPDGGSGGEGGEWPGWPWVGIALLGVAAAGLAVRKWLSGSAAPEVDCDLELGGVRTLGLDAGSIAAPAVAIEVAMTTGEAAASTIDVETLESDDDS